MQRANKGCAVEKCRYATQKALMRLLCGRDNGDASRRKKPLSDVSKADSERITEKQRKPPLR
jgi:hypothetical protein